MPVLDLYLPDDLPLSADYELGRALALIVDEATAAASADPCTVFVHRLPVYAVVSASVEGLRAVRVQLTCTSDGRSGLAPKLEDVVRDYLREIRLDCPTRIVVSIIAAAESNAVTWSHGGLRALTSAG